MCSPVKSIDVFKNLVVIFSGSNAHVSVVSPALPIDLKGCNPSSGTTTLVGLRIVDVNGNPMPVGTTIAVTTSDGTMTGISTFTEGNTDVTPAAGAATHFVTIKDDSVTTPASGLTPATCADPTPNGFMTVTVTTPGGVNAPVVTTAHFRSLNDAMGALKESGHLLDARFSIRGRENRGCLISQL